MEHFAEYCWVEVMCLAHAASCRLSLTSYMCRTAKLACCDVC
jgi:hypothetical protein